MKSLSFWCLIFPLKLYFAQNFLEVARDAKVANNCLAQLRLAAILVGRRPFPSLSGGGKGSEIEAGLGATRET